MKRYKHVKQRSITDCGAACLAAVAETYGLKISLDKVRELADTDRQGNNMLGLMQAADKLGFKTKAVKGDFNALTTEKYQLPAIAHITQEKYSEHYVLIHKVASDHVVIGDPASGIHKITMEEFLEIWSGNMLLIQPKPDFNSKKRFSHGIFPMLIGILAKKKGVFGFIAFMSLCVTLMGIVAADVYSELIDNLIPSGRHEAIFVVCFAVMLLYIIQNLLEYFRGRMMTSLSTQIDDTIVTNFVGHVLRLPPKFFSAYRSGEIISRFSDAASVREGLSGTVLTMLVDVVMAVISGFMIYRISPVLFEISLAIAVIYGLILCAFNGRLYGRNEQLAEDESMHMAYTLEAVDNSEMLKACNAEGIAIDKSNELFKRFLGSYRRLALTDNLLNTLTSGVACTGNMVLLMIGADLVMHGNLTLGVFFKFTSILAYFLDPVKNILGIQSTIQTALVSAQRLGGILELDEEKHDDLEQKVNFDNDIFIENLRFRYGSRDSILENMNMHIKSGSKTAIVGTSGSGKSTLAKLLLRFFDYEEGSIRIGESEIDKIDRHTLRENIAYISQDLELFTGSIRENLKIAKPDASEEEMIEACKNANLSDLINRLPGGLDYTLDERGTNLSVGERQRLTIARAFLRNPKILILDEAMSNLDSVSERKIWNSILAMKGVTVICIAHRLASVISCDEIFVFSDKKVAEHGNHESLSAENGFYSRLWAAQSRENAVVPSLAAISA